MHASDRVFRVAFTGDFYKTDGAPLYRQFGLEVFDSQPAIRYTAFPENLPEIDPAQIGDAQGVIVLSPRVTAGSVSRSENLLAIGRFGVGYDSVDVDACTAADVALVTAVGAVDRSVAEATVGWMLALTHHVRTKDRLVREGNWQARVNYMGRELRDRTLGVVGMGGIGRALVELLRGFGMNAPLAFDPFLDPQIVQRMGVQLVGLEELMSRADFVSIHCPLNEKTRNLIGARELALMKSDAYLINTARGGIVDEDALYETLRAGRIAGAALDCFVGEPITKPHRFGAFEQVLLAPHAIAWTDEMFREMGRTSCQSMVDLAHGRTPRGIVNRGVLERPGFQQKWARLRIA
ncbi:MAG: dehydrogenase [Planctomycetia bacterium]|nr:dehydrogenase [Planctomycetia bacterium]